MIIKDKTDPRIEKIKTELGLSGDVYVDALNHIESLESHRRLLQSFGFRSSAQMIETAEIERFEFEEELEHRRSDSKPETDLTLEDALTMLSILGVDTDD